METKIQDTVCPHCGCIIRTKKDTKVRSITHGETSGSKCIINLKYIRYKCKECQKTFYEDITDMFEFVLNDKYEKRRIEKI